MWLSRDIADGCPGTLVAFFSGFRSGPKPLGSCTDAVLADEHGERSFDRNRDPTLGFGLPQLVGIRSDRQTPGGGACRQGSDDSVESVVIFAAHRRPRAEVQPRRMLRRQQLAHQSSEYCGVRAPFVTS